VSGHPIRGFPNRSSQGAAAILEYNVIESPLAQPRNLIGGHFLSALIGICVTKLFELLPAETYDSLRWLAGAISVGVASAAMTLTKTVHPPAGATALLCSTSLEINGLGWVLLPLVLLGSVLMLASASIINNIQRQYPIYWWSSADLSRKAPKEHAADVEKLQRTESQTDTIVVLASKDQTADGSAVADRIAVHDDSEIKLTTAGILVPRWLELSDWETNVLQIFQDQLIARAKNQSTTSQDTNT